MAETQNIQWFPGHMTKTFRKIAEQLKIIDVVAEIVDARIPFSSRNGDLLEIIGDKPHIILLNKCDLADDTATKEWIAYYKSNGIEAIPVDCKSGEGIQSFKNSVKNSLCEKIEAYKAKGMIGKPLRVMIVGIPNVGKSSFINRIAGQSRAKAENRPGVTRGNQWFTIEKGLELLDTPGVLWPKFENETIGEHLAFTGAVTDRVVDTELLAIKLLDNLSINYPKLLTERYGELDFTLDSYDRLCQIAKKRAMVIKGGEVDSERAANMLLEEFRNCKLGRITLERVKDYA